VGGNASTPIPIGLCGEPLPTNPGHFNREVAIGVAELGFAAVTLHLGSGLGLRPDDIDAATCARIRDELSAARVRIVQSWMFGASFVAEPDELPAQLDLLDGALRVAADLGAEAVIGGCGSLGAAGHYAPHPANHTDATATRLVEALKRAAELAERKGICLALEPHVLTALHSPERVREIVDAVGSPAVRVNLDAANLVAGIDDAFGSSAHLERCFDLLAPVAVSGHLKDVQVRDDFVLHLDEAPPGNGVFDLHAEVRLFAERLPGAVVSLEHLQAEEVPRAKAALDRIVSEALA
jgi:sugar phosphate isomerase/epimerase